MLTQKRIQELIDEVVGTQGGPIQAPQAPIPTPRPQVPQAPVLPPQPTETKPHTTVVKFDANTDQPFEVKFSERGFLIGNTRLSFEALENAISKEYNIVLEKGNGLVLTQVRMQKILKYKDLY